MPSREIVSTDHPLVGTWITEDEDSDLAISIEVKRGQFKVASFVRSSGESLTISKREWDGKVLSFSSLVPSSGWRTKTTIQASRDGSARVEFTHYERWVKKDVKPNETPKAWKTGN